MDNAGAIKRRSERVSRRRTSKMSSKGRTTASSAGLFFHSSWHHGFAGSQSSALGSRDGCDDAASTGTELGSADEAEEGSIPTRPDLGESPAPNKGVSETSAFQHSPKRRRVGETARGSSVELSPRQTRSSRLAGSAPPEYSLPDDYSESEEEQEEPRVSDELIRLYISNATAFPLLEYPTLLTHSCCAVLLFY